MPGAAPVKARVERPGYPPYKALVDIPAAGQPAILAIPGERRLAAQARGSGGECAAGTVFAAAAELWEQAALALRIMAPAEELGTLDVRGGRYVRVLDRSGRVQQRILRRGGHPHQALSQRSQPVRLTAAAALAGGLLRTFPRWRN